MKPGLLAAFALTTASSLHAQTATSAPPTDFSTAVPIGGRWVYSLSSAGSDASFLNASAIPQVTLHCTKATRRVSISRPAIAAAPYLFVWTSSQSRNLAAGFDPKAARLSAELALNDPLLDAMAFSRGRIAVSITGTPALIVPPWPELARVVEDCRT